MNPAVGALLYLRLNSLRNMARSRLQRLRQPRYLLGGVIGIAYLYFFVLRRFGTGNGASRAALPDTFTADNVALVMLIAALALLCVFAMCWLLPRNRAALAFSEAEVAFLFPAPVTRRTLVHYQLLSSLLRTLLSALILSLIVARNGALPGTGWMRFLGWWLLMNTLSLHFTGSAFALTRLQDRGVGSLRRILLVLALLVAAALVVIWWWQSHPPAAPAADLDAFASLAAVFTSYAATGPLHWLLLPTRWLLAPLFAGSVPAFLQALGPALLVYAAHYLWVLRGATSFEDATIARAEKRASRVAAIRAGNFRLSSATPKSRAAPFKLAATPRVELAFLWKNLLGTAAYLRLRTALVAATLILLLYSWPGDQPGLLAARQVLGAIALALGAYALILGPQLARQDLRGDLLNMDLLKTYPLHGWQVVLGELLTPLAVLSMICWLCLLIAGLAFNTPQASWASTELRAITIIGAALAAPLLAAIQLVVVNAATLLFPAWQQLTQTRASGGIDVMGQRILFMVGQQLVMILSLLPAAIVAGLVLLVARLFAGDALAAAIAGASALAVLAVEAWVGIGMLGERFDHFDLSAELVP
jgi:hypothetical protein